MLRVATTRKILITGTTYKLTLVHTWCKPCMYFPINLCTMKKADQTFHQTKRNGTHPLRSSGTGTENAKCFPNPQSTLQH